MNPFISRERGINTFDRQSGLCKFPDVHFSTLIARVIREHKKILENQQVPERNQKLCSLTESAALLHSYCSQVAVEVKLQRAHSCSLTVQLLAAAENTLPKKSTCIYTQQTINLQQVVFTSCSQILSLYAPLLGLDTSRCVQTQTSYRSYYGTWQQLRRDRKGLQSFTKTLGQ